MSRPRCAVVARAARPRSLTAVSVLQSVLQSALQRDTRTVGLGDPRRLALGEICLGLVLSAQLVAAVTLPFRDALDAIALVAASLVGLAMYRLCDVLRTLIPDEHHRRPR